MSSLPAGWALFRVGDLGDLRLGKMLDRSKNQGTPVQYLRNINVRWFRFDLSDLQTMLVSEKEREILSVRDGDLLICEGGEPGRCAVWQGGPNELVYQKALHRIRTSEAMVPEFLMYRLRYDAETGALRDACSGTTIKHLTRESLSAYQIAVPPIDEQKRIADKLDAVLARVDACRERLDVMPRLLKRLRQSILAAAVAGELSAGWRKQGASTNAPADKWKICQIKDVGRVQLGRQRSPKYHSGANMRPYLRVQNVFEDRLDLSDVMEMDFPPSDFEKYKLHLGDILLNEGQSPELLGRPAMFCGELDDVCFTNTLIRFQAYPTLLPDYALLVFRHYMHSGRFRSEGTITTNIAHLGAGRFASIEFHLPPLEEQREIVRRAQAMLDFVERLNTRVVAGWTAVDRLTPALLGKAFRGELVSQDPNDEPAAELLTRLADQRSGAGKAGPGTRTRRVARPSPSDVESSIVG